MNLWSILILAVGAVYLTGFSVLVYCANHAREGYEDVDGFRLGAEPVATLPSAPHTLAPFKLSDRLELADAA